MKSKGVFPTCWNNEKADEKAAKNVTKKLQNALGMYRPLIVMLSSRKDPFQYVGV